MILSAQWHSGNITTKQSCMWRTLHFLIHSEQHLTWIQKHFSPWSAVILGHYSNLFCCLKPLLFSVLPMKAFSSWMSSSSVVLLDSVNWKHTLIYKYEELEVYKWAHCLRKVASEQSNTFSGRLTGYEWIMFHSTISHQVEDWINMLIKLNKQC